MAFSNELTSMSPQALGFQTVGSASGVMGGMRLGRGRSGRTRAIMMALGGTAGMFAGTGISSGVRGLRGRSSGGM